MIANNKTILGIDLGGTKILTAVIDAEGKKLSSDCVATPAADGFEAVVAAIVESSRAALKQAGIMSSDLFAVGLAAPGLIDAENGIVRVSPNLPGWKDAPLGEMIEKTLGKPVFTINDAHAAAVGELYFGAGRGCRHFIYITVSTGIGGGLILNGEIYEGSGGLGGEIGHMVIDDDGPLCYCGNRGCWEMLASGRALEREARRRIESGAKTTILSFCLPDTERSEGEGPQSHPLDCVTAKAIHAAAKNGDVLALELINRNAYYFGVGLANIINIFNPERIIIGGGLSNLGDMLLKPAIAEAGRRAFRQPFEAVKFMIAELGQDSGIIGAAAHARQRLGLPIR
jgi:glucokinase